MIQINNEIKEYIYLFKKQFDDIVPLRQISLSATNEQLIAAIKKSIVEEQNLLPEIFGYSNSAEKTY